MDNLQEFLVLKDYYKIKIIKFEVFWKNSSKISRKSIFCKSFSHQSDTYLISFSFCFNDLSNFPSKNAAKLPSFFANFLEFEHCCLFTNTRSFFYFFFTNRLLSLLKYPKYPAYPSNHFLHKSSEVTPKIVESCSSQ